MDSEVSTTGSLSVQIKEHEWQGVKNFHLLPFNLILTSSHFSILNCRRTKVKEALSFAFFVVSPLCLFHSSPLSPLLAQWTLHALWPLTMHWLLPSHFGPCYFFTCVWNLSLTSWLTMKQLFDLLFIHLASSSLPGHGVLQLGPKG